jgi:hypothetical protein
VKALRATVVVVTVLAGAATCTCQRQGEPSGVAERVRQLIGGGGESGGGESGGGGASGVADGAGGSEAGVVEDGLAATQERSPAKRLTPEALRYRGAFRLPDEFAWGARGATFRPGPNGGTLLVTGFELSRTVAGAECSGGPDCVALYGEVRIPRPTQATDWERLPAAELVGPMRGFDGGAVRALHEYTWVSDIEWVPRGEGQSADRLYGSLNLWYAEGVRGEQTFPTIWFADVGGANPQGLFHVGPERVPFHGRKMGDYLFRVPQWYGDRYLGGRVLVTGRARGTPARGSGETIDGGSQGPTLFAFHPFAGGGRASGHLDAIPVLYYRTRFPACAGPNVGDGDRCDFPGYTMCDLWTGAAFVEGPSGRAIVLAGYKGLGSNCYDEPPVECHDPCSREHGYHCHPYERQVLFYDADELGRAATGQVDPWAVLPYHVWRPTELYLDGHTCWTMGGMAIDAASRRLFVIERGLGDGERNAAVVHVWSVL